MAALIAALLMFAAGASAQAPTPTPHPLVSAQESIFSNKGEADLEAVKSEAKAQMGAAPFYKSNGEETRFYEGYFKAATSTSKLALLSDDGTSVWIDGQQVLERAGQTQGFEGEGTHQKNGVSWQNGFEATFSPLSATFEAGKIYHLKLQYTNTIHSSDTDVDGASLWAYDGGGEIVSMPASLTLSLNKPQIVAGGWNETRHAYEYLEKESGDWKARDQKSDPHLATLTATLKDEKGNALSGKTINFKWDMPGPAPEKTPTATTDSNGVATVDIVSGDTLSKALDDKDGHLLYDEPVEVEASYGDTRESKKIDVLAARAKWQYKDEQGSYQDWDGSFEALFAGKNEIKPSSLQVVLSFDDQPVIGHRVNWKIIKAWNLWGNPVKSNAGAQFTGYGHLSGDYSTTNQDGDAQATYIFGRRIGKLKFALTDSSVLKSISGLTAEQGISSNSSFPLAMAKVVEADGDKFNSLFTTGKFDAYTWVKGEATYDNLYAYPAPSGLEDWELLKETDDLVRSALRSVGSESLTGKRGSGSTNQNGAWWYAQVIGMDSASGTFHRADMSWIPPGAKNPELHGAAFDIVLTNTNVFADVRPKKKKTVTGKDGKPKIVYVPIQAGLPQFKPYVTALRGQGAVAWNRWVGEPGSAENELHAVDPAMPFLKKQLDNVTYRNSRGRIVKGQTRAFLDGETGGGSYLPDYPITTLQQNAVIARLGKRGKIKARYPGARAAS